MAISSFKITRYVIALFVLIGIYSYTLGVIIPELLSAPSNMSVLGGFTVLLVLIIFTIFLVTMIVRKIKKSLN